MVHSRVVTALPLFGDVNSIDDEVDAHVDAPLPDSAVVVGGGLDLVDPHALDVLHRGGCLLQPLLHGILDAAGRRGVQFDDLGDGHGDAPLSWRVPSPAPAMLTKSRRAV